MVLIIKKFSNKEDIDKVLGSVKATKQLDASKYSGKLKLSEDAITIQKRLRDEWK